MEITEVRVFLRKDETEKVKAYITVTFDNAFVVRDLKILDGKNGLFVAMPSRRMRVGCPKCNHKNNLHSRFCGHCGQSLAPISEESIDRKEEHKDIAHPITTEMRTYIQNKVIEAYNQKIKEEGVAAS